MNYFKGKNKEFSFRDLIYKALIFIGTVGVIVYFLPRDGKFNYQFDIDKPWKYGQLMATFDFPIYKDAISNWTRGRGKWRSRNCSWTLRLMCATFCPLPITSAISKKYYPRCTGQASFPLKSLPGCTKTAHLPLW